jgi:DNA-binding NtrC family response regulator
MSTTPVKILIIDDEKPICVSCRRILQEDGHDVEYANTARDGLDKAIAGDFALVLLDLKLPDLPGMDVLERLKTERPEIVVIIITGYATIQTSIEAIKKGAFNYVPKPFTPEELSVAVTKALEHRSIRSENEFLRLELSQLRKESLLLGRSRPMDAIRKQILRIAPTTFTVTVLGESGTGKELVAREIHNRSRRADRPFVAVDLSSLSAGLVESELFGHVRGAFTGASRDRPGYFVLADTGTLFLDEIANVSLELQGKLLRVLETRRVRPVGSEKELEVDVRLIAATNRDLHKLAEQGQFREDLYYRLNVIPLQMPPLRERTDDIPMLALHFLRQARESSGTKVEGFTTEAMARLVAYRWPGNVRELRNIVERLAATADQPLVRIEHLPSEIAAAAPSVELPPDEPIPVTAEELKEAKRRMRDLVYEKLEKQFILSALDRGGWNVTHTATLVGMQRPNFHALMRKYGIRTSDAGGDEEE